MARQPHRVVKTTLRLDPEKLVRLQHLLQTTSASAAVRQAIDETLAYSEALQAARRIQRRGTFARD
jgi:predicted DNA-binding protein